MSRIRFPKTLEELEKDCTKKLKNPSKGIEIVPTPELFLDLAIRVMRLEKELNNAR